PRRALADEGLARLDEAPEDRRAGGDAARPAGAAQTGGAPGRGPARPPPGRGPPAGPRGPRRRPPRPPRGPRGRARAPPGVRAGPGADTAGLLGALAGRKVTLTDARRVDGPQVADQTFALLLALTRNLLGKEKTPPVELRGKSLLLVGLGGSGEQIARRAAG